MAPTSKGQLEKLRIEAYDNPDYSEAAVDAFFAYVNPAELALSYEIEYDESQGTGTTNSRMEYLRVKPGDLTLNLFLDGTNANGVAIDVQGEVEAFQRVTGYSGEKHRTRYLKVLWGTMSVRRCVLKSATITYKLFRPNGVPLRANIQANFKDNADDVTRVALEANQSADLTHARLVHAGDTLPGLCTTIYGSPDHYLYVAAENGLDAFRELVPGSTLTFPPLLRS